MLSELWCPSCGKTQENEEEGGCVHCEDLLIANEVISSIRDAVEREVLAHWIDFAVECFGLSSGRPIDGLIAAMIMSREGIDKCTDA